MGAPGGSHKALRQVKALGISLTQLDIGPKPLPIQAAGRVNEPILLWEEAHLQIVGSFLIRLP